MFQKFNPSKFIEENLKSHTFEEVLVKSIKDSGSIVRDIFRQLDDIEYGAYNTKTGSFVYETDGTNYRDIKLLNPEETLKYKRGTCYEQSILTAYLATQHHLKYNCSYYLNICGNTHMACSVNYQGKWYWLEHAWYNRKKLYGPFDDLNDINSLIPNQATTSNQLADKAFVNSTVATNAANFRGNWNTWQAVPTVVSDYPEDYTGSKTPTNNDYLVIQDASGYNVSCDGQWRFI